MTPTLEGGEGSVSRPGRSSPPEKTRNPLYRKLGGSQVRCGQVRKILPLPGFDPRTVQPVASCYTDDATRPTHYTVYSGNFVTTFWDDLFVPSSRAKKTSWPLKIEPMSCPETSVRNYHSRLRNIAEQRRCHLLFYVYGSVHCELTL
jgi:hypothetical protein